ncbi:D-inositol-3-phosphate glycosyltransferase [subsurface metagenome]
MIDTVEKKKTDKKLKMVISTSTTQTMATLGQGQISFYRQHGFDVDVFAAKGWGTDSIINEGAEFFEINFVRDMSPTSDLKTAWRLFRLFRIRKPDVIQLMTLKPCILGALAGRMAAVPLIIRHKWGNMRDCNYKGLKRFLLFSADKMSNKLAHRVVVICHKLKESEVRAGAVDEGKAVVYGSGSSNGLDLNRFKRTPEKIENGKEIRRKLSISQDACVLGTAMRINIEKGICELVEAFCKLAQKKPQLHFLIVGEYDIRNLPPQDVIQTIEGHPRIHFDGMVHNIEDYYAAMDVFVMPSYREGFCKSNIEASGMELPVVATDIIGCSESVKDSVSGLLVPPRQSKPLANAIEKLLTDRELAKKLGKQGRQRVEQEFDQKFVWHNQLRDISSLLKAKGISPPVDPEDIRGKSCPLCTK